MVQLLERRRKAQLRIERGKAIVERGNAELAECDRFEAFYRSAVAAAKPDPADAEFFGAAHEKRQIEQLARSRAQFEQQSTLKKAIKAILANHPEGLLSGDLLTALRQSGYPGLLRTSMSPQLSRMKDRDVVNVDGKWTLIENKTAASLL
ncbi:MAG: hypothetical protein KIT25_01890 [Enhydrobacter sp.]|nr:MAG: hypothetical protein KIT25_01890 [Enhydrobacter sp.]